MLRSEYDNKYKGGRQKIRIQKAPIHETRHTTKKKRHTTKDEKAAFIVIIYFVCGYNLFDYF